MCIAKGDSAASHHYWKSEDQQILDNVTNAIGPSVQLPNNKSLQSTQQGEIPLSHALSTTGKHAMILPGLKSASLISLGQLCDDKCTLILDEQKLLAIKNNQIILRGI